MRSIWFLILLGSLITYHCLTTVSGEEPQQSTDASQPTFDQCKPYVEAALKTSGPSEGDVESQEDGSQEQASVDDSGQPPDKPESTEENTESQEADQNDSNAQDESQEVKEEEATEEAGESQEESQEDENQSKGDDEVSEGESEENQPQSDEAEQSPEENQSNEERATAEENESVTDGETNEDKNETQEESQEQSPEQTEENKNADDSANQEESTENSQGDDANADSAEGEASQEDSIEQAGGEQVSAEETDEKSGTSDENATAEEEGKSEEDDKSTDGDTKEDTGEEAEPDGSLQSDVANEADESESGETKEDQATQEDTASLENKDSPEAEAGVSDEQGGQESAEEEATQENVSEEDSGEGAGGSEEEEEEQEQVEPYEPRSRDHIIQILGLDDSEQTKTTFSLLDKVTQTTLKELKNTYENAIKPLEQLYKYRDLSNRHFGDPEIFSKPLIVFMGPWSGGKSTIINWLLGIQHEDNALRTGADPSPAQFNIMMYGKEPEKLDGTQLAADWTFSGLQKFGQSFLDRLRGQKLPNRLLEKVNIVEIPGILEVRKQVERSFPFNDACQWFIDRADTLFLIYDPAKLDIGPETEAILDQLKGRENQVRIVLNKADTVKPDELLRVQAMLVWNISPLMSSAEPPVLYAASLWDRPLQVESPKSLLVAHENNFLKDIRDGVERRVETRIAAARRFAVRVRNHAKMVDCYLNTYNNHRSFFSDRKKVSTDIIDHPQNYHIYEGLSTLTNISRYDLPDPDTYRDFFRLNPLWDFPTLQSTCSFWRGCPLHKLDIAIAYDLPEILGKFRRQRESILAAKTQSSKN